MFFIDEPSCVRFPPLLWVFCIFSRATTCVGLSMHTCSIFVEMWLLFSFFLVYLCVKTSVCISPSLAGSIIPLEIKANLFPSLTTHWGPVLVRFYLFLLIYFQCFPSFPRHFWRSAGVYTLTKRNFHVTKRPNRHRNACIDWKIGRQLSVGICGCERNRMYETKLTNLAAATNGNKMFNPRQKNQTGNFEKL